ncbi:hypothetical protein ACUJ8N_12135 [Streptomyces sp. ESR1.13]|uniref:Uncharacterized protein n=1 Tax=Streptomyces ardesiacus TaxID=285564 RepID=A0ABW8H820_9ACTN|nr:MULTISPECIES: hypothetical protein [unclassified Streptomyces]KOT92814.1 hypothetical protein ADK87_35110 [Streptomyces sp. NRRL F-4711]KOX31802.1 hypothetical protein ADL07_14955 [Streptomyces sp. NRRL F-4707]KOX40391.1 hypothetical protein ADL09_32635 [Streptomyces sp. NRRL F-7442]NEB65109.1 hypothetical protein [Streptomyces diastaticus]
MAMVGLFWITEDCVYMGAEPTGTAAGVRLTGEGVEILGHEQGGRSWGWGEVRGLDVRDVAVRSARRRLASMAFDSVVALITGDGEQPPYFTVRVETEADGTIEANALIAVTGGIHTPDEYELSRTLLARLADGTATVGELVAWRREEPEDVAPTRDQQVALLRGWTAASV